jgi:hypothetical protein
VAGNNHTAVRQNEEKALRRGAETKQCLAALKSSFIFAEGITSLTTIRGASYKLDGTELSGYARPFLRYLQSPRIDFSRWDIVISLRLPEN